MDNKKLMQILLRDVAELEEIVSGIRQSGSWVPFEIELLSTRISGVRHMLEVVSSVEVTVPADRTKGKSVHSPVDDLIPPAGLKPEPETVKPKLVEMPAPPILESDVPVVVQERNLIQEIPVAPVVVQERSLISDTPVQVVENSTLLQHSGDMEEDQDEMELEEEAAASPQTLGEKFSQGRSVNDLLLEHGKSENKFTNMPVTSLQAAIGINDRFLFTRELFEGNGDAFAKAVKEIDAMSNIHDAASYLREHFKWKKNETSLKFIDLVKRRFGNR